MADSLLVGPYEVMGIDPEDWDPDADWDYQLLEASDLGAPVPDTAVIAGVLLDGDRVTGMRSGNRQVTLPIAVKGTDRLDLGRKVNDLIQLVDAQRGPFVTTWTPSGGLPLLIDSYRGTFTRDRVILRERQLLTIITLTFPAAPFGRSDQPMTISAVSPQLTIDAMDATTPPTGATRDTTNKYEGTASAAIAVTRRSFVSGQATYYYYNTGTASRNIGPIDLSTYASIGMRVRWPAPFIGSPWPVYLTLTVSDGTNTASATVQLSIAGGYTGWTLAVFPVSQFVAPAGFGGTHSPMPNWAAIQSWSFSMFTSNKAFTIPPTATPNTINLDIMQGLPGASVAASTPEGAVVTVPAVPGTARAPLALTLTHTPFSAVLAHRPPVDQSLDAQILTNVSPIPADKNTFRGTYVVWLVIGTVGSGTRTVTVTFTHKQGATVLGTATVTAVYAAATGRFVEVGRVTLPIVDVPAENGADTLEWTIASSSTGTNDTFLDIALCDLRGQTVVVGVIPSGTTAVYIDAPDPARGDIGQVYVSATDRTAATSVLGQTATRVGGGPFAVDPGDNRLLVVCPDGTPGVSATLFAQWLDERTV